MSIYSQLFPWQKELVDRYRSREKLGLFLDMGLGKTPISLGLAEANGCTKVLVITVNSKATESSDVKGSWGWWGMKSAVGYRIHDKKTLLVNEPKGIKGEVLIAPPTKDMLVINYEALYDRKSAKPQLSQKILAFLNGCANSPLAVIVDESHKIKDLQSLQTKAVTAIIARSKVLWKCKTFVYLLTGTPFTVGYQDLYSQLKVLGMGMNKGEFLDTFCIRDRRPGLFEWQQPIVGYKNLPMLFRLIKEFAVLLKSEDMKDEGLHLPEQVFVDHPLPQTDSFRLYTSERASTKEILRILEGRRAPVPEEVQDSNPYKTAPNPFYRNIAYPDLAWSADTAGTFWLRARQISIGFQGSAEAARWFDRSRLQAFERLLCDYPGNYVVFYNYTSEFVELYDICERLKYNTDVYNGDIKSLYYYDEYSKLPEGNKLAVGRNVILANYSSGSVGKNWQEYSRCVLFSLPLYKDFEQGIKRINRIGSNAATTVYHVFYQDSWLDRSMYESLRSAKQYSQEMFEQDLNKNKS